MSSRAAVESSRARIERRSIVHLGERHVEIEAPDVASFVPGEISDQYSLTHF